MPDEKKPKSSKKGKFKHKNEKKISKSNQEKLEIQELQSKYAEITKEMIAEISTFSDMPLSVRTQRGLSSAGYIEPTDIQREAIPWALKGEDILGAAKTGSGKTVAFLVPLLEKLYCQQWTKLDGCGAIVISPTRELSKQIYDCLAKIAHFHEFTMGLVIGGQGLEHEKKVLNQCNIIICTPGRLLHHMDTLYAFLSNNNLQVLVLDEADRCLDMGFEKDMNAIIENLPVERQTLLFSATQKTSVRDLARLSLKNPTYCSVHENLKFSTPDTLEQFYVICELKDKISILWSFIRMHKHKKIIVFLSNCKSVKFVYQIFCKMQPGMSLLALYGTMPQPQRNAVYASFCEKTNSVLFATDVAARGLHFPKVNWVVQVDCPENVDTYIHRVGRTARREEGGQSNGESLLMLLPNEEPIIKMLQDRRVPIEEIDIDSKKISNPIKKMQSLLAKNLELKECATRAVVTYSKSMTKSFLMKEKIICDVRELDLDGFSQSLGLAVTPRLRHLQRQEKRAQGQEVRRVKPKKEPKENKNHLRFDSDSESDNDDDILQIKREDHDIELPVKEELQQEELMRNKKTKVITKAAKAKKLMHKQIVSNKKIIFDDDGQIQLGLSDKKSELAQQYEKEAEAGIDIVKARAMLKEEDVHDKKMYREKMKLKRQDEKIKKKLAAQKKKDEQNEQDDFGEDDDESDTDRLDWLPDPDEIYDKNNVEDIEDVKEIKNVDRASSKRKFQKDEEESINKKKKKFAIGNTDKLSVNEAEELAMLLLNSGGS